MKCAGLSALPLRRRVRPSVLQRVALLQMFSRSQSNTGKCDIKVNRVKHGRALLDAGETGHAVAQSLGVSRATLYRALAAV